MSRQQTKATHYIQTLDEARCSGDWNAVPELVRKIRKHAPDRMCLTLAAECEHAVTEARLGVAVPTAIAGSQHSQSLSKYIPQLLTAVESERTHVEDAFQAQVCLGWLHWHLGEPALAVGRLPKNIGNDLAQFNGHSKEAAEWTKVCALKASYVKGSSLAKTGAVAEGLEAFVSGLPILAAASSKQKQWREVRNWIEVFLTGFCMLSSQAIKSRITSPVEPESLAAFRTWGAFCDGQGPVPVGGSVPHTEVSQRLVWKEYYTTLSSLLQQGLSFPPTHPVGAQSQPLSRSQQRAELKRVESQYETILLNELQFPSADKFNQEVEAFLEIVIQNWNILCGGSWKDSDLGEGGAEAVSRGVLDILYRGATKTFHSTAILRHLFSVHVALAEFDLAVKAFDTYMDIVKTAKARIEQTGEPEPGLDDDETILNTASECIMALCRYGSRQGAEKAKDIGQFFEAWLNKHNAAHLENGKRETTKNENGTERGAIIAPKAFALAWRCIGISHAQWARLTFDTFSRSDLQSRAVKCFRRSLLPEYESEASVETLFALGTILAERRDLATAIETVKFGLLPSASPKRQSDASGPYAGQFVRERSLIPLWHLMALLLSARQEFSMAVRSCEGAFEQFKDPRNLFGEETFNHRSDHLNEKSLPRRYGVVDDMDDFEKQNVLEVKMTQLMLIEVMEGPEIAVNSSGELLSLYSRLFGDPSKDIKPTPASNAQLAPPPPSSSAGTIRSLKGSIFGRSIRKSLPAVAAGENIGSHQRSNTIQTITSHIAPAIQITSETGKEERQPHLTKSQRPEKPKGGESVPQKKSSGTIRKRAASAGQRNMSVETGPTPQVVDGEEFFTPPGNAEEHSQWLDPGQRASQVGLAISPDSTSIEDSQDLDSPLPPASQEKTQEVPFISVNFDPEKAQDSRLSNVTPYSSFTSPVTRFPRIQQRQRRAAILVKVWLLISAFYRRAALYDDAKGAIEEAHKLVQSVDTEISSDKTGNLSTAHTGWGGSKSLKELWADVCVERGALAVAESSPYAALGYFEAALTHFADHPAAIVGLSKIMADIYDGELLPPPSIPPIVPSGTLYIPSPNPTLPIRPSPNAEPSILAVPASPLGMSSSAPTTASKAHPTNTTPSAPASKPPPEKDPSATLLDKVAARDRAYGLLSTLTKLGTGWNNSEAWFALARSYELGGQLEKSRECLWWCVELEESRAVRDWSEVLGGTARGGYVL